MYMRDTYIFMYVNELEHNFLQLWFSVQTPTYQTMLFQIKLELELDQFATPYEFWKKCYQSTRSFKPVLYET